MKLIEGGFKEGIDEGNAIFEELAQKHNPAWKELVWGIKETQPLRIVKK